MSAAAGTIAILGPGGVGGFLAGALARAGEDVVVVAREQTAADLARDGLRVSSVALGDFHVTPRAVARLEQPVAALIVACKAPALAESMTRVATDPELVLPLLNGCDHMEPLRAMTGAPVAAGAIRIESTRVAPGVIEHTSPFLRVDMGSEDPRLRPALETLRDRLQRAGVPARVLGSEVQVLWFKLVRLNALALATSAYGLPLGEVRADAERDRLLMDAAREGAEVARAEGAAIDDDTVVAEIEAVHPGLRSSMQRDIEAGRPTELDAIAGAVLRAAGRHGIDTPAVMALSRLAAARAGEPVPAAT